MPKLYFQSQFSMSKINQIFSKKISSKNINLGDHFLLKTFFSRLNFWTTLLSKIRPNFCRPHAMSMHKIQQFHLNTVDFWAKTLLFRTHQARNSMTHWNIFGFLSAYQYSECSFSGWGQFLQSFCRSTSEMTYSRVLLLKVCKNCLHPEKPFSKFS